ncbi:MAG: FAD-binding oxidoreductase [Xanthobacteraceae bacterium]|nr:FAD-binding oxidoreductase [Xanthobacteraceae bacterium]
MPFEGHTKPGFEYQTLLIEPPIFLARLEADLLARQAKFVDKKFASKSDVLGSLTQNIIVNCTGFGAMKLWSDPKVVPIKGQLAMLPAQPNLQYLYGQDGYMFPRADHVVIGGTFEVGVSSETPNKSVCKSLVSHIASLFGQAVAKPLPDIHIHHPDHAPIVNPAIPSV